MNYIKLHESMMRNISGMLKNMLNEDIEPSIYSMNKYHDIIKLAMRHNDNEQHEDIPAFFKKLGFSESDEKDKSTKSIRRKKKDSHNIELPDDISPEMIITFAIKTGNKIPVEKKEHLQGIIGCAVQMFGLKVDLSFIDTSMITDMSELFMNSNFNGNISNWDVSHVTNMSCMFANSTFNGDISKWNVCNVIDMSAMFANSFFDGDISKWDVSEAIDMKQMFEESIFNGDISKWDVSKVRNMARMFKDSAFNGNISKWNVSNVMNFTEIFVNSDFKQNINTWKINPRAKCRNMRNTGLNLY
ncbi:MAG: hypothetical protein [Wendovervirus sonii]|uniref:BspA family leucine-rich repeat surface protein n=1 Tax=phage Lak_Megaphage_Sonny TaxID=3109229 RepID=A0ABZ0Z4C2_9CAUD|nr:MAG: hypothetical protein [phage Lak_Megaphage_Sonny]